MSYKVIVADDERIIRESLTEVIDWQSIGFEIVQQCVDGRDVIEYIKKSPADVILTDIKMTHMTGIEVAKYVYDQNLDIKIILISGYKEFDLAVEAMKYGVSHYVLKPTDVDKLEEILKDVKSGIDNERKLKEDIIKKVENYEILQPVAREQFFLELMMGAINEPHYIQQRFEQLCPEWKVDHVTGFTTRISFIQYEDYLKNVWTHGKLKFIDALKNFISFFESAVKFTVVLKQNNAVQLIGLTVKENNQNIDIDYAHQCIKKLTDTLLEHFKLDTVIEQVKVYDSIYQIASDSSWLHSRDSSKSDMLQDWSEVREQQKFLLSNISVGNLTAAHNLFNRFIDGLSQMKLKHIQNAVVDTVALLLAKLNEFSDVDSMDINVDYRRVYQLDDIEDIKTWFSLLVENIIKVNLEGGKQTEGNIIRKAKRYIEQNFSKDISLEEVSEHLYMSPVYFSRIFKQQTGENFIDFVVRIRMEKAITLLKESHVKIYEVSENVGYLSTRYFSKIFKRFTGYTPGEFRKNVLNYVDGDENSEVER